MKTVAFSIQKGGTGKTSLAGNVAYLTKFKTLLIDGDPQGSVSSWFLTEAPEYELADVLQGKATLSETMLELKDGLYLVPTFAIGGGLRAYSDMALDREPFIFQNLREEAESLGFEVVIYDLGPAAGRLERCVLLGCDEVVTPLTPEYFSVDGIEIFKQLLQEVQRYRGEVQHRKIVLNLINRSFRRHVKYRDLVKGLEYEVFEVGQDAKLPEAQILHKSLVDYAPGSKILPDLRTLAEAIEG